MWDTGINKRLEHAKAPTGVLCCCLSVSDDEASYMFDPICASIRTFSVSSAEQTDDTAELRTAHTALVFRR